MKKDEHKPLFQNSINFKKKENKDLWKGQDYCL